MSQEKPAKSIENSVMKQISSGEVKMKSRAHFVLLNSILISSASLFAIVSAIFVSLTIRDVQVGRKLGLGEFGDRGNQEFIQSLPWLMLLFGLLAIAATVLLVKHFEFTYRHKTTVILGTVLISILGIAAVTSASGLNDKLIERGPLRPLNTLQKLAEEKRVYGTVVDVGENNISVLVRGGKIIKVEAPETTKYLRGDRPEIGDKVVIFGEQANKDSGYDFEAFGIRKGDPRVKGDFKDLRKPRHDEINKDNRLY